MRSDLTARLEAFRIRHDKILRKLERCGFSTDFESLSLLPREPVLAVPGFGTKSEYLLDLLLEEVNELTSVRGECSSSPSDALQGSRIFADHVSSIETSHRLIPVCPRWGHNDKKRKRAWRAFAKVTGEEPEIEGIVELHYGVRTVEGLSSQCRKTLSEFAKAAETEVLQIMEGELGPLSPKSTFRWGSTEPLEPDRLDQVLVEDLEDFILGAEEKDYDMLRRVLGFHCQAMTLAELADKRGVSRQAVAARYKTLQGMLREGLRLDDKMFRNSVEHAAESRLISVLPRCAQTFQGGEEALLATLDSISSLPGSRSLKELQLLPPRFPVGATFSEYLEQTPAPFERESLDAHLRDEFYLSDVHIERFHEELLGSGLITRTEPHRPTQLTSRSAVLHVLAGFPMGLHWTDVARACEVSALSRSPVTGGTFSRAGLCEPCGRGVWRHVRFFSDATKNAEAIVVLVRQSLLDSPDGVLPLEASRGLEVEGYRPDYWELRFIVSRFGEDLGVHFKGRSGVDTVSLSKEAAGITNTEAVFRILSSSDRALTRDEIIPRLRTRSRYLLSELLHRLQHSGRVIRVSRLAYWTPERALEGLDVEGIKASIKMIVEEDLRPIEAASLRDRLAAQGHPAFGKELYRNIANDMPGLYLARNLIAESPIPYESLVDCVGRCCESSLSTAQNIARLQETLRIPRRVATGAIYNWSVSLCSQDEA